MRSDCGIVANVTLLMLGRRAQHVRVLAAVPIVMSMRDVCACIDHFLNELFINSASGYESCKRHGDYLPRPIVG